MILQTKFQDENFDLGEVINANIYHGVYDSIKLIATAARGGDHTFYFKSLKELNGMFEDCEEAKQQYYIKENGDIGTCGAIEDDIPDEMLSEMKEIGNYFETEEEAEKAVEKLKAWTRLKGHNLRVERGQRMFVNANNKLTSQKPLFVVDTYEEVEDDLDLLFGGEDE